MEKSVAKATGNLVELAAQRPQLSHVLVRHRFVRRAEPAPPGPSDRSLPEKQFRPPATRLLSPHGASLRFYATALFEAQAAPRARPGQHPGNKRPLRGTQEQVGWEDLLASPAQDSRGRNVFMSEAAKKRRQLNATLLRLHREELVALPNIDASGSSKCEHFELLDEGGVRKQGANEPYLLPGKADKTFAVPTALFTAGWIHVLEDSEIAFFLMVASLGPPGAEVKIAGEERLLHYGFGRANYDAHDMLERLGLLEVVAYQHRRGDGTVEDFENRRGALELHSFKLLPQGLETSAWAAVMTAIDDAISHD
jgi:hypothetical protein